MNSKNDTDVKMNVQRFDEDVSKTGSYAYTAARLSSQLANARISRAFAEIYPFQGKRVLDLGCGDGTYTVDFVKFGVESVLGIDPARVAVEAARSRAIPLGVQDRVQFAEGNIYDVNSLLTEGKFDVIVLRGVLHHLPDPRRAISGLSTFRGAIVIMEPNGLNPVLKILEKVSRYHIEHEERSFLPTTIYQWLESAGFEVTTSEVVNLVPMFCPDWLAKLGRLLGPIVERIPVLRSIICGQLIVLANR